MLPLSTSNAPHICYPYLMAKHWERQKTQITLSPIKPLPLRILRVVGSELSDVQISFEDKTRKNKRREKQKRKQSSFMYALILRTSFNRLLRIIFSQARIWRELGMFAML